MTVTESGIVTFVNMLQAANTSFPMLVSEWEMVTLAKEQPAKAPTPRSVTE